MKLYFSLSNIPELAAMTRRQRRLAWQCALEALYSEQPESLLDCTLWVLGGLLGGAVAGCLAVAGNGLFDSLGGRNKLLVVAACGLAGVMAGVFIAAQLQTSRLRPYLRRVLEERKDELESWAKRTGSDGPNHGVT